MFSKHISFQVSIYLVSFMLRISDAIHLSYNYRNTGPDIWHRTYTACGGKTQSPIHITDWTAKYAIDLLPISFTNYDKPSNFTVTHTGHTVLFSLNKNTIQPVKISGSNFNMSYSLVQFHFHWGENELHGSEHVIDFQKFLLELHLVHNSTNGSLAVVSIIFQVDDQSFGVLMLQPFVQAIDAASINDTTYTGSAMLQLASVFPDADQRRNYYRYIGSLTAPPCTEGILWTVFDKTVPISVAQLQSFHKNDAKKNFRPPQRYCRTVYSSNKVRRPKPAECAESDVYSV